jgi:hypothetical protein
LSEWYLTYLANGNGGHGTNGDPGDGDAATGASKPETEEEKGQTEKDKRRLADMMKDHQFGKDGVATQQRGGAKERLGQVARDIPTRWRPSLGYRYDDGHGVFWAGPGFNLKSLGYLAPKADFIIWPRLSDSLRLAPEELLGLLKSVRWTAGLLFTTSASRWFDWYGSVGGEMGVEDGFDLERRLDEGSPAGVVDDASSEALGDRERKLHFVVEAGFKLRIRTQFGVRLGIRTWGFRNLGDSRFVAEVGMGRW